MAVICSIFDFLSPYGNFGGYFQSDQPEEFVKCQEGILTRDNVDTKILEQDLIDAQRSFNLNNALFWAFSSLFWQSPDQVPKCFSARVVACCWAAASVIFICCYTANLITFVSQDHKEVTDVDRLFNKIYLKDSNVDGAFLLPELYQNLEPRLFTMRQSLIENMLENTIDPNILNTWTESKNRQLELSRQASSQRSNRIFEEPHTLNDHVLLSMRQNHLFFWEKTNLDYAVNNLKSNAKYCPEVIDSKILKTEGPGIIKRGFAFRKDSLIKPSFDYILADYVDSSSYKEDERKWLWNANAYMLDECPHKQAIDEVDDQSQAAPENNSTSRDGKAVENSDQIDSSGPINQHFTLKQLSGVFVCLAIAALTSLILVALELMYISYSESTQSQQDQSRPIEGLYVFNGIKSRLAGNNLTFKECLDKHCDALYKFSWVEPKRKLRKNWAKLRHRPVYNN